MASTLTASGNVTSRTPVVVATPNNEMVCPSIFSRIVARLCTRTMDRLVEAGASPQSGSALAAHMLRLGSIGHRERLAAELRRRGAVLLCDRVMSLPPSRVNVPAVWDTADLIERVASRLLIHHDVCPRGIARLRRLIADWTGPLRRCGSGDLCTELRAVLNAL
jgi:hypothetical protein